MAHASKRKIKDIQSFTQERDGSDFAATEKGTKIEMM
jgi:hypothetical protein